MNKHVDHICCRSQEIDLHTGCTIPILQAHRGYQTEQGPSDGETPIATRRPRTKKMQETHTVRLKAHFRVPPMTQMPVEVDSRASCLAFLEPKLALRDVKQVRMANGIIEVTPWRRFRVLLSNFSRHPRRFPKVTVLVYATRDPINNVTPDREVATHCGEVIHIDTLEQCGNHECEIPNPTWADTRNPSPPPEVTALAAAAPYPSEKAKPPLPEAVPDWRNAVNL